MGKMQTILCLLCPVTGNVIFNFRQSVNRIKPDMLFVRRKIQVMPANVISGHVVTDTFFRSRDDLKEKRTQSL